MRCMLLIAAIITTGVARSQSERFNEGWLLTKTGDTLKGLISWKKNLLSIDNMQYKRNASDIPKIYSWSELSEVYNQDNKKALRIASVRRNLEYIDGNDYTIRFKDSVVVEVIPLERLYKGEKLSLYHYYDKAPFYFIYDGKQMLQLVQRYRYLTTVERMFDYEKGRRFNITDEFRGLLSTYYDFSEDNKLRYVLDNTLYEEASLRTIVSKMDKKLR